MALDGPDDNMVAWWEYKLVQPLWETVWKILKKLEKDLPCDPEIPLLEAYLKEMKTLTQKDNCTPTYVLCSQQHYLQ